MASESSLPVAPEAGKLKESGPAEQEDLELTIDKLVAGGDGLGRFEGFPIFVPRSAPGDRLKVRLTERKADYGRAEILEILSSGSGRREPPCRYFSDCGGCDLQHLEDAVQTKLKAEALRETLQRLGGFRELPPIRIRVGNPWGYRLRTQLHTEDSDVGTRIGYLARGSHRLVPVDRCPVLVPQLEHWLPRLPGRLGETPPRRLDLCAGGDGAVTMAPRIEGLPHGEVKTEIAGFTLAYDARCFFQAHHSLLGALVEEAVGDWAGTLACDLYGGVGLFSLPLARTYDRVVSVEGDRLASRFARNNVRRNRVANVEVVSRSVESWITQGADTPDRVLVDPPRTGLSPRVRSRLLKILPKRLTYVSCHPATLARDLRAFKPQYRLESITALELFPQTGHLEAVVQLVLRDAVGGPSDEVSK